MRLKNSEIMLQCVYAYPIVEVFMAHSSKQTEFNSFLNTNKMSLSNVPGDGACGFTSLAKGAVDACFRDEKGSIKVQEKLLSLYLAYHPENQNDLQGMSNIEKLKHLMRKSKEQFFVDLGFYIRQLAVKEEAESQKRFESEYGFALPKEGDEKDMRKHNVWISERYMVAAAEALGVRVVTATKGFIHSIPANAAELPSIYLQLQSSHYRPYVSKELIGEYEHHVNTSTPIKPASEERVQKIEDLEQKMIDECNKLLNTEQESYNEALAKISENDFSIKDLLDLYTKVMGNCDYLQGRIKYMDIEYNNAHDLTEKSEFYAQLLMVNLNYNDISGPKPSKDMVKSELIHAISRSISIGNTQLSDIFSNSFRMSQ